MADIIETFPSLALHDRVAIVVPDVKFRDRLMPVLQQSLQTISTLALKLVHAVDMVSSTTIREDDATNLIMFDTIDNMDGLER